ADVIVTTGGMRDGDAYTEAEAGANWLVSQGVPVEATLPVGEGSDTLRSLRAAAVVLRERDWNDVVLVSDPWHSLRAKIMAEDAGLSVWTSPTQFGPIAQTRSLPPLIILLYSNRRQYFRNASH